MESTVGKNKNVRNNYSKRKKSDVEQESKGTKIIGQLIICAAIFLVVFTVRNIDSSFTNYLSKKTSLLLRTDAEFSTVLSSTRQFFSNLNINNEKLESVFNSLNINNTKNKQNPTVIPPEMQEKIYDYELLKDKNFVIPVNGELSSGFGIRVNPITKKKEFHKGIDVSANNGDNIRSILDGEVVKVDDSKSLGNYVQIKHGENFYSLYAHASKITVKKGQNVNKGDKIAKVGNTGWSVGPHVHIEIWKEDKIVNPEKIFDFDKGKGLFK